MAEQTRGEHARVVDGEEITGAEDRREIRDGRMTDRAGPAVEDEQPRCAARRRILRDQLVGKLEIEIGNVHAADHWPMYCGTIPASNI